MEILAALATGNHSVLDYFGYISNSSTNGYGVVELYSANNRVMTNDSFSLSFVYQNGGLLLYKDEVSAVPIPAAVWLFGSGLIGLAGFARGKKA